MMQLYSSYILVYLLLGILKHKDMNILFVSCTLAEYKYVFYSLFPVPLIFRFHYLLNCVSYAAFSPIIR